MNYKGCGEMICRQCEEDILKVDCDCKIGEEE